MGFKTIVAIVTLLTIPVLAAGCMNQNDEFVIRLSGTAGIEFRGEYGYTEVGGQMRGKTRAEEVESTVPAGYTVSGDVVWCSFKKVGEKGVLRVEIFKGERIVAQSETSEPYGSVYAEAD